MSLNLKKDLLKFAVIVLSLVFVTACGPDLKKKSYGTKTSSLVEGTQDVQETQEQAESAPTTDVSSEQNNPTPAPTTGLAGNANVNDVAMAITDVLQSFVDGEIGEDALVDGIDDILTLSGLDEEQVEEAKGEILEAAGVVDAAGGIIANIIDFIVDLAAGIVDVIVDIIAGVVDLVADLIPAQANSAATGPVNCGSQPEFCSYICQDGATRFIPTKDALKVLSKIVEASPGGC